MKPGQLDEVLKANGIERSALVQQVTASIVWAKLVRQIAADTDPVSDEEVDDTLKRLKQNENDPQSRVAEIFLAVDNPQQDAEVLALAQRLIDQMKQGARFSAVAQQFSQSATAAVGGDIGWIRARRTQPAAGEGGGDQMRPGELSPPIRTPAGYYILLVLDRRNGRVGQRGRYGAAHRAGGLSAAPASRARKRGARRWPKRQRPGPTPKTARICCGSARRRRRSCRARAICGSSQISPAMRSVVLGLGVGQPSEPIVQKNGIGVIMVCKKTEPQPAVHYARRGLRDPDARARSTRWPAATCATCGATAYVDVRV